MQNDSRPLTPTEAFFLDLCRNLIHSNQVHFQDERLDEINWGEMISLGARHKILPLLAYNLLNGRARSKVAHFRLNDLLQDCVFVSRYRYNKRMDEAKRVQNILHHADVKSITRKGTIYDSLFYQGLGLRSRNDLDFYIGPQDRDRALIALKQAGYVFGRYSQHKSSIIPLDPIESAKYRLYPDHLAPLVRISGDTIAPSFKLDIAFDLTWHGSWMQDDGKSFLFRGFESAIQDQRSQLTTSPPWFHFIDCAIHLFREGFFENSITLDASTGVTLHKFIDIALIWGALLPDEKKSISAWICGSSLSKAVAWVAHHCDEVMKTSILYELSLDTAVPPAFYSTWSTNNGSERSWNGVMIDRVFARNAQDLFCT